MRHPNQIYVFDADGALLFQLTSADSTPLRVGDVVQTSDTKATVSAVENLPHSKSAGFSFVTTRREGTSENDRPIARPSPMTDFLRYHALVRVFDGDVQEWLSHAAEKGHDNEVRFLLSLREILHKRPELMGRIRSMVDDASLWP